MLKAHDKYKTESDTLHLHVLFSCCEICCCAIINITSLRFCKGGEWENSQSNQSFTHASPVEKDAWQTQLTERANDCLLKAIKEVSKMQAFFDKESHGKRCGLQKGAGKMPPRLHGQASTCQRVAWLLHSLTEIQLLHD